MSPRSLTEREMEKIDDAITPLVYEALTLADSIKDRLPCAGATEYKRSPVRSVKAALKHLKAANDLLKGIE